MPTIQIFPNKTELAQAAAAQAIQILSDAIKNQGNARLTVSTGVSQFEFLALLTASPEIDWGHIELFHLDEYLGIDKEHPASFQRYVQERVVNPTGVTKAHLLNANYASASSAIGEAPVDLTIVGIGENGHLAFNDPPADFETELPYLIVTLDEPCRMQQVGEGWFGTLADVPKQAVTMSIKQILKSRNILCIAPELRKANAVKLCFEGEVRPEAPASALRLHPNVTVFLDQQSASLLR